MKNLNLMTSVATVALTAFMSDTCEVVSVNGGLRVNKADYDADQAEGGKGAYKLDSAAKQEGVEQSTTAMLTEPAPGVIVPPAPSAPNFKGTDTTPIKLDPETGAALPPTLSENQYATMQKGKKFIVVLMDGTPVTGVTGIDEAGYATNDEAIKAVNDLPR